MIVIQLLLRPRRCFITVFFFPFSKSQHLWIFSLFFLFILFIFIINQDSYSRFTIIQVCSEVCADDSCFAETMNWTDLIITLMMKKLRHVDWCVFNHFHRLISHLKKVVFSLFFVSFHAWQILNESFIIMFLIMRRTSHLLLLPWFLCEKIKNFLLMFYVHLQKINTLLSDFIILQPSNFNINTTQ